MTKHTAFWDDLARDLEDPEFLREYVAESMRIATIDAKEMIENGEIDVY